MRPGVLFISNLQVPVRRPRDLTRVYAMSTLNTNGLNFVLASPEIDCPPGARLFELEKSLPTKTEKKKDGCLGSARGLSGF